MIILNSADDSLWVKVLKSIDFPKCDFMIAMKGSLAPWIWNNILMVKNSMKNDLVWQVGDGNSNRCFKDP